MRGSHSPAADADTESEDTETADDQQLAVVVHEPRSQVAIESRERRASTTTPKRHRVDRGHVAVPVTAPPQDIAVREVVRQVGKRRLRTLDDHLRERGWTDTEIAAAPSSWAVLGSVVLVDIGDSPRPAEVGDARWPSTARPRRCWLATASPGNTAILASGIAGDGDTETVTPITRRRDADGSLMMSSARYGQRARMGEIVSEGRRTRPRNGRAMMPRERRRRVRCVAVGYPHPSVRRRDVTAVERNRTSFRVRSRTSC